MVKHKDYQFWVPVGVIGAVVLAAAIGVAVAMQPLDEASVKCGDSGARHTMIVEKDTVAPASVSGMQCDLLTIINQTGGERTIMFGHVENMQPYDGVKEKRLANGESLTVHLYQKGDFHFHEHETDLVGNFTVR